MLFFHRPETKAQRISLIVVTLMTAAVVFALFGRQGVGESVEVHEYLGSNKGSDALAGYENTCSFQEVEAALKGFFTAFHSFGAAPTVRQTHLTQLKKFVAPQVMIEDFSDKSLFPEAGKYLARAGLESWAKKGKPVGSTVSPGKTGFTRVGGHREVLAYFFSDSVRSHGGKSRNQGGTFVASVAQTLFGPDEGKCLITHFVITRFVGSKSALPLVSPVVVEGFGWHQCLDKLMKAHRSNINIARAVFGSAVRVYFDDGGVERSVAGARVVSDVILRSPSLVKKLKKLFSDLRDNKVRFLHKRGGSVVVVNADNDGIVVNEEYCSLKSVYLSNTKTKRNGLLVDLLRDTRNGEIASKAQPRVNTKPRSKTSGTFKETDASIWQTDDEAEFRQKLTKVTKEAGESGLVEKLVSEWKLSRQAVSGDAVVHVPHFEFNPPLGGNGGSKFGYFNQHMPYPGVKSFCGRSGALIDRIDVTFSDGHVLRAGGGGGGYFCFSIGGAHCINQVNIRTGSLVDGLQFRTSAGHVSHWFGGHGGHYREIKSSHCLKGVYGRSGVYLDQLSFFFA